MGRFGHTENLWAVLVWAVLVHGPFWSFSLPTTTLETGLTTVAPVPSVRDLGILVDTDLVMRTHVSGGFTTTTQHPSPCLGNRLPVTIDCRCSSLLAGLLQWYTSWSPSLPYLSTAVGSERSIQAHIPALSFRPQCCARQSVSTGYECWKGSCSRSDLPGAAW